MFFSCGSKQSAAQWVHRIRWTFQGLPNDVCGDASGRPAILEGELPGKIGNARKRVLVVRALRPPPQPALRAELGRRPPQRLQSCGSPNHDSATVTVNVALSIVRVLSDRYRRPVALSSGKAASKVYERCGPGMAGLWAAFVFLRRSPSCRCFGNLRTANIMVSIPKGRPHSTQLFHRLCTIHRADWTNSLPLFLRLRCARRSTSDRFSESLHRELSAIHRFPTDSQLLHRGLHPIFAPS